MRIARIVTVLLMVSSVGGNCAAATRGSEADLNDDQIVDWKDLQILARYWLHDFRPQVRVKWLGHASVKIWQEDRVVYVDPRHLKDLVPDATLVLITHSHGDHLSTADINRVSGPNTLLIGPPDVIAGQGWGQTLAPGDSLETEGIRVTGVPAYNTALSYHPRANNWLGYVIELGGKRIYCAGDTDLTPEMSALVDIDVAFLPAGGGLQRFGAGPTLDADQFWRGLIDDLRLYSLALSPEEVAELGAF